MSVRGRKFEVVRSEGKVLGVCAGLARSIGVDATIVRIGFVLVTLMGGFPWTLIAYLVAAFVGQPRSGSAYHGSGRLDRAETQDRMRSLDLRMQAIETYATSSNSRLAREIEELR
jgi:phage shock protein C